MRAPGPAELVGAPALGVVGEVRADDALREHPQVAVVELVQEAARRRARDDLAAATGDEHGGAERVAARMLEHDVGIAAACQLAHRLAEPEPLLRVLTAGVGVPEAEVVL